MALVNLLASYVPRLLLDHLEQDPTSARQPAARSFEATVLFADISGFTPLAERLAQRGSEGVEELIRILNGSFGELVDGVTAHGGDVFKFAGDALLALWPHDDRDPTRATLEASRSALAIQAALQLKSQQADWPLALRVAVSVGRVTCSQVGGLNDHWELMVTGAPLDEVARAHHLGMPGDVALAPAAWALICEAATGEPLSEGFVRLESVQGDDRRQLAPPVVSIETEAALWHYLPRSIVARLEAHQDRWLAELRQVSCLFVSLAGLSDVPLERSQRVIRALEEAIARTEGSLNKLSVDEKGVTLIAAYGLPPLAHEDDALRAVQTALAMRETLQDLGVPHAIGIASGRAFCGEVGSDTRREYTMIGDSINLAARLMQAAGDGLLCDQATHRQVQDRVRCEELPALTLKGKAQPVQAYRPVSLVQRAQRATSRIIGRREELTRLEAGLRRLQQGHGERFVIEADAGMGKSRLVEEILRTRPEGIRVLSGAGDAIEKAIPYHAWREVLARVLELEARPPNAPERERHLLGRLRMLLAEVSEPEWRELLPLLNALLPLELPETDLVAQMNGQARADNTDRLLLWLLQGHARLYPTLLVIDDAHWLDSASWRLLRRVSANVAAMLVVATRPMGEPVVADYRLIVEHADAHLKLEMLSSQETVALVCQRLGVRQLPLPVADLIRQKAEGHPFFSEELANSLQDAGLLLIEDGEIRMAEGADLRSLDLPTTVEGVITTRVDRLSPSAQLAIKVASVIGRVFAFRTLRDVFPVQSDRPQLPHYLEVLERLDLTPLETPEPELAYVFKHIITQEVVYNLMLVSQRQQLHRSVAEWIERTFAQDLERHYPMLAHHWSKADAPEQALSYLEKAGAQALQSGAYPEATGFYEAAFEQAAKLTLDRAHRGHLHQQLGRAYLGKGSMHQSQDHFHEALRDFDHPFPASTPGMIGALLKEVAIQAAHRFWPEIFVGRSEARPERHPWLEIARVLESLYEILMFGDNPLGILYCNLRALNLAERLPPTSQQAWGYAMMSLIAGTARIPKLADLYETKALDALERIQDLPVQAGMLIRLATRRLMTCQWDEAVEWAERGIAVCDRISDHRKWAETLAISANARSYRGDLSECLLLFRNIYAVSRRLQANQFQCWGANGQLTCLLRLGRFEEGLAIAEANVQTFAETLDHINHMGYHGQRGTLLLRLGRHEEAWEAVVAAERMLSAHTTTYAFECCFGVAEVALGLLTTPGLDLPAPRQEIRRVAERALKFARSACSTFDHGQPQERRYRAQLALLDGKRSLALRLFAESIAWAQKLRMPYELALAHRDLARALPGTDPARSEHLEEAVRLFTQLEARYDLEGTQAERPGQTARP